MKINNVLVIGAGVMGQQVGLYYSMYGFNVTMFDISEEALSACKIQQQKYLPSLQASRPHLTDEDMELGLSRISYSSDLEQCAGSIDLVTESAPEVLEIKLQVYADLNRFCPEHTIFTTNTSTMMPSQIAEKTGRPERFLALHYGNTVWDCYIGEVMGHPGTDKDIFETVCNFVETSGLVPIRLEQEQPGYIINSLLIPWLLSGLSLVVNGISTPEDVDKTWMLSTHMDQGPLGVMDQVGFEVACNIYRMMLSAEPGNEQHKKNLDYLQTNFLDKGHTGRLSGQGFYSYPNPEFERPDFLGK
ncbi:MAG TPA: 3-hydroxyacyl-CoA dehydrogenase [Porticoccus sp.]|nr:3-hydroxyacyl-CoA dehydrogenase [Porticoccus sp.]